MIVAAVRGWCKLGHLDGGRHRDQLYRGLVGQGFFLRQALAIRQHADGVVIQRLDRDQPRGGVGQLGTLEPDIRVGQAV